MSKWARIASILLCASSAAAAAEEEPICADRPGRSSQTCTVPQGQFQVETSFADWTLDRHSGQRDPSLLIADTATKYGLTDRSHIELDFTPWQRSTSHADGVSDSSSGFGDLLVVYKHQLTAPDAPFEVAVSPSIKIPTAKRPIGNGKWEGALVVPMQYAIPKSTLVLSATPELDRVADGDGHGHHLSAASVIDLAWQTTRRLNLSIEIWGQWDWDPGGTVRQYSADGAVAYLLSNDVQLDAGVNLGLNRNTPDVNVYSGVAVRF